MKYARIERERRFLLAACPPDLDARVFLQLDDLYVDGTRLRLRTVRAPDGAVVERKLSQKIDVDPSHRTVTSIYLDAAEHARLASLPGARLVKRRHRYDWNGTRFGIDVFLGDLGGLVLAEVEAASDAALTNLPVPAFAHCEVTHEVHLTGGRLAYAAARDVFEITRRLLSSAFPPVASLTDARLLVIRPLVDGDPPVISAAFTAMGWTKPEPQYRRYLAEQSTGKRDVLVALHGGTFAGYLTIAWAPVYEPFRTAGIPEIQDLNVLAHLRRRGIASALLDEAEARIAERSRMAGIGVGLHPGYNAAQPLYVRRGYVPDGHGVAHAGRYVKEGDLVPFDDDLVLFLTKAL